MELMVIIMVIALVLVLVVGIVTARNRAISQEKLIEREQANVQTVIQNRVDSISQLIDTAKRSEAFERDVLTRLTDARAQAESGDVRGSSASLRAVGEAYPSLKTIDRYAQVMDQTVTVENRLENSRRAVNTAIQGYETMISVWPSSMFLSITGYQPKSYEMFTATVKAQAFDPTVDSLWGGK